VVKDMWWNGPKLALPQEYF
jgi:hypothetical protein